MFDPKELPKLFQDQNECWNWWGTLTYQGYGIIRRNGKRHRAHRFIYEALIGPIPVGCVLDHLCRNKRCINPSHLDPVSNRTNVLRGVGPAAANARKTYCGRGHAFKGSNVRLERRKYGVRRVCRTCRNEQLRQRRKHLKSLVLSVPRALTRRAGQRDD